MTGQEVFDIVARHLLTQGAPAMLNATTCAYRAANGHKCAIGALIPDPMYSPDMEGKNLLDEYVLERVLGATGLTDDELPLLRALQRVHDDAGPGAYNPAPVADWPSLLRLVAKNYSLNPAVIVCWEAQAGGRL